MLQGVSLKREPVYSMLYGHNQGFHREVGLLSRNLIKYGAF